MSTHSSQDLLLRIQQLIIENGRLQSDNDDLQKWKSNAIKNNGMLIDNLKSRDIMVTSIKRELSVSQANLAHYKAINGRLRENIKIYQESANETIKNINADFKNRLAKSLKDQEDKNQSLAGQVSTLKHANELLIDQNNSLEHMKDGLNEDLVRAENELQGLRQINGKLRNQNEELQQRYSKKMNDWVSKSAYEEMKEDKDTKIKQLWCIINDLRGLNANDREYIIMEPPTTKRHR